MKRLLLLAICLVGAIAPASSWAQRENSLRGSMWALQFSIAGDFDLDEFAGGVSFKRHFSPKSAIRVGIEGVASTTDLSRESSGAGNDGYNVSVSPIYQRYVNPESDANFYWGAGPFFQFGGNTSEGRADSVTVTDERDTYALGVSFLVGVEWFASKVISLHAEYLGSGSYQKETRESTLERVGVATQSERAESESWSVGSFGAVRFGLSVYF